MTSTMSDSAEATPEPPLRVLFVCTGNICRSPMAAAITKMRTAERGINAQVASCGLMKSGRATTEHGIAVMADWGVDMSNKVSRQIDSGLVRGSDLILAMATHHARRVVGEDPSGRHKVFLLRELVGMAITIGPRLVDAGQTEREWLRQADKIRRVNYKDDQPELEIEDPIGQPRPAYEAMQQELDQLLQTLISCLWP